jgi:hypothetical protein
MRNILKHDNQDMKHVHQDYLPTNDLLLSELFAMIVVVFVDQIASVGEHHHHQQRFLMDHLDQIYMMDY